MKNNSNITVLALAAAFICIAALGLYLSGFPGNSRSHKNSFHVENRQVETSRNGSRQVRNSGRSELIGARTSSSADDGNRFPDTANLDIEIPAQTVLLQHIKETEKEGSTPSALARLLKESLAAKHGATIRSVSDKLVGLGDEAVPELMSLLDSGDKLMEATAFSILSRIGTAKALVALIGKILNTADREYSAELEKQFAGIQTPAVTDTLLRLMLETDQPALKSKISAILSSMEGGYVVKAVTDALEHSANQQERIDLIGIMAGLKKVSNIAELESVLSLHRDAAVQQAASVALANIGNARACEILAKYSDDPQTGSYCRALLATVNSPYGQKALLDILEGKGNSDTRASAATALGNYASSDLLVTLENWVQSETDNQVKTAVQESVASIKNRITAVPADVVVPAGDQSGQYIVLERTQK